jgi:hypothetical protein
MKWLLDTLAKYWSELRQDPLFKKILFKKVHFGKVSRIDRPNDLQWPLDEQIIALNLLGEGAAFEVYRTGIPISEKLMILSGQYWNVPADGKMHHPAKELDPGDDDVSEAAKGKRHRVFWHSARLYHQMLSSWVGEQMEALKLI